MNERPVSKAQRGERAEWSDIRVFAVVAEKGSMAKAAEFLGVTQGTISRAIERLEESLSTRLMTRSQEGIRLTEAGELAFDYAQTMARSASSLSTEISSLETEADGQVTVAAGEGLLSYWMAPRVGQFQDVNPKLRLTLISTDTPPNLMAGEADISIQYKEATQLDVTPIRLCTMHWVAVASQSYLDTYGEPLAVTDLFRHRVIWHTSFGPQIEKWPDKSAGVHTFIDRTIQTNSGAAMHNAAVAGAGIAVLPSFASAVEPRLKTLKMGKLASLQIWLLYPTSHSRIRRVRHTVEWLKEIFDRRKYPWFRDEFVHPDEFSASDVSGLQP